MSLTPVYAAKIALVIGNSDYDEQFNLLNLGKLTNPVNDATDMAKMLENLGFEVILKTDVREKSMKSAVRDFSHRLRQRGDVGLFFFSGHGFQYNNVNYLVPLRADIQSDVDIEEEAFKADYVLRHMERTNQGVNIMILDACRNSIPKDFFRKSKGVFKGVSAGLADMKAPTGTLIAYATAPNKISWGGLPGERNSVYTKYLLKGLRHQAHLSITDLFIEVRNRVMQETKDEEVQQVPWESVSLTRRFCFGQCGSSFDERFKDAQSTNNQYSAKKQKLLRTKIEYFTESSGISVFDTLKAKINDQEYVIIGEDEEICMSVEDQRDFDDNGSKDVLVANILGCGGNCCGNSFLFVSYQGDGHFQKSDDFGYSWVSPSIEKWKGKWSVLVEDNEQGVGNTNMKETKTRYILDSGSALKVEESSQKPITAIIELNAEEFDSDNPDEIKKIVYDLNDDGINEEIIGEFWLRWGSILWKIKFSDGSVFDSHVGCKRIGVLKTKTRSMHDLVCDHNSIYRWNGHSYQMTLIGDANFKFGESSLTPQALSILTEFVGQLDVNSLKYLKIVGHTDSVGRITSNQKLSEARAQSVANFLKERGIPAKKLKPFGKGETQPVATNQTEEGRAQNRRVEITVVPKNGNELN